jgi:hypothetical protein
MNPFSLSLFNDELKNLPVINYMDGISYQPINPLMRLKMIACSYIRGETTQYYRSSESKTPNKINEFKTNNDCLIFPDLNNKTSTEIFDEAVKNSLQYDFENTIRFAVQLRNDFLMRTNPQCIMMAAAMHPKRVSYNIDNPKVFKACLSQVISRPDDMITQLEYWISKYGNKQCLPTCVKKVWAKTLENMDTYQLQKYKRYIPDLVRICHAKGKNNLNLNTIMNTGHLSVSGEQQTWETLRSRQMPWIDILNELKWHMPHMAALRNLIPFAKEVCDEVFIAKYGEMLINGVLGGKQYPFRYLTAYQQLKTHNSSDNPPSPHHSKYKINKIKNNQISPLSPQIHSQLLTILENCLKISLDNFPTLEGDTLSLCDNSGSARGSIITTYGITKVSDIANLSALLTAIKTTGRGIVGVFGDKLELYTVDKNRGVLEQWDEINLLGNTVGQSTENGIWLAFKQAFINSSNNDNSFKFDNIFIYSDMQAGHGGLYGLNKDEYKNFIYNNNPYYSYIDLLKLINTYRHLVNPLVNLFSIQVAGYDNNLIPENIYRGAILSGWTGNEVAYAKQMITLWDQLMPTD